MPARLINLRNVPDDEIEELLALLTANEINHYVTPAGNWGISAPAIWLQDKQELGRAKQLLDGYQGERFVRVRKEYEQLKREGKQRTMLDSVKEDPVRFILYLVAVSIVVYLSTMPFTRIGQ